MRMLFDLDLHDYPLQAPVNTRRAVRAVIRRDGLWLMQRDKQGYHKVPGGGIEPGETHEQALAREVMEETGMRLIPSSVQPIGMVLERRLDRLRGDGQIFEQCSYYYLCDAEDTQTALSMTESELAWGLHPLWIDPEEALRLNRGHEAGFWMTRDTRFLDWFLDKLANDKEVVDR